MRVEETIELIKLRRMCMNNARRKIINRIADDLECIVDNYKEYENHQMVENLDGIDKRIVDITSEEEEAFNNLPENLQDSDRGQVMQDAIENLEEASEDVCEASLILSDDGDIEEAMDIAYGATISLREAAT